MSRNDDHPKNPNANLGAGDDIEVDDNEEANVDDVQEQTAKQELGIVKIQSWNCFINFLFRKEWHSPIYAFFKPKAEINYIGGRHVHDFTCNAKVCKGKGKNPRLVCRNLDTGDRKFTGGLHRHAKSCLGEENITSANEAKNIRKW